MFTVALEKVRFNVPVGLYPQEAILYNDIEVNVRVSQEATLSDLPFINYAEIYTLVKAICVQPTALLETLLQQIVSQLQALYPTAQLEVSISKLNPPLGGNVAAATISWTS